MIGRAFLIALLALAPITTSYEEQVEVAAKVYSKPALVTRAFPLVQTVDIARGCSNVQLFAEIVGPEVEEWYCPRIEWEKPDGTVSVEESDCPPFEKRNACYPERGGECALDWHIEANGHFVVDQNPCDCTVPGYPRIWRLDSLCAPAHPTGDAWTMKVRLMKNGKTLAQNLVTFLVR